MPHVFFYEGGRAEMKILVCDDEKMYLDALTVQVREYMRERGISCEITPAADPVEVWKSGGWFDLAFLDIQMGGIDGIGLAKELRRRNGRMALFFVTNYAGFAEYQDEAMDLQAFRFFEKPFDVTRLYAGLDKAMEYISGAYVDIFLIGNGEQRRVLVDDILYITRLDRRVILVTRDEEYRPSQSYDELCQLLPALFFYPVHKSFYVNLHYVNRYAYSELNMIDGTRIPVAPGGRPPFTNYGLNT